MMAVEGMEAGADVGRPVRLGWRGVAPGVLLVAVAAATLYEGRALPAMRGFNLGPGTWLSILAAMLLLLGFAVGVEGFLRKRTVVGASFVPAIVVAVAGGAFALTIGKLGLAVATGLVVAIVGGYGLRSRPVACVLVVVGSVAVIVAGALLLGHSDLVLPMGVR